MSYQLPDLPYALDALAPHGMSQETLEYHHGLHHKAYVDQSNQLVPQSDLAGLEVEEIVRRAYSAGEVAQSPLFNNISQMWNHNQFWQMMAPGGTAMPSEVEAALVRAFGSVDEFKAAFKAAGAGQFGAGWAWLVQKSDGSLAVTKSENGVNPLCFGQTALLGLDVWEHSYYIDFRNKRPAYIENFLENLVDWENVAGRMR